MGRGGLLAYTEEHLDTVLAVLNVPVGHRKGLQTTNHVERVNQELKRRGRTVRIWPNPVSRTRPPAITAIDLPARTYRNFWTLLHVELPHLGLIPIDVWSELPGPHR